MVLRLLVVMTAIAMLLAPSRVWTAQRHFRGTLFLILDDTRSMSRIDPPQTATRASLAESALHRLRPVLDRFDISVLSLSNPSPFTPPPQTWYDAARAILQYPHAPATAIGRALEGIDSDTPSTLLLISDGRQNQGPLPETAAKMLSAHGSYLFTLNVGSPEPVRDASVEFIDAPSIVIAGDDASLTATLRLDAIRSDETITAALTRDGQPVTTKIIDATPTARVEFTDPAPPEGDHAYAIAITPLPSEATTCNNQLTTRVSVRREKIHVLLLEDEPRWEYQFLKTLLTSDRSVDLKTVLLQPARIENIAPPPSDPIPSTRAAWSKFDVVILGDIAPANLTSPIQSELAQALGEGKPTALILIGGPRNMPARFVGAPLATLVPVDLTENATTPIDTSHGFNPRFSLESADSILTRLDPDEQSNAEFWSAIPPFYWHSNNTIPRPGAHIVWSKNDDPHTAILSAMNFGAGRVLFLATPETWRLRYVQSPDGRVADLHRHFWSQAMRWSIAGEPSKTDSGTRDPEDQNQSADPARLAALAKAGGGASFDISDTAKLAAALPNVDHLRTEDRRLGLFEDPQSPSTRYLHWATFLFFVGVLTTEWIVRKRRGLV